MTLYFFIERVILFKQTQDEALYHCQPRVASAAKLILPEQYYLISVISFDALAILSRGLPINGHLPHITF